MNETERDDTIDQMREIATLKELNDELLAVCKELLEDGLKLNEDEYSRNRQYMLQRYGPYVRAQAAIAKTEVTK